MKHLHWLANCTVLNPLGTQVCWLWQYLCSEVRHTLGVILFCPLRVNITGYLWNLLTHSTHPLTGPHVNTICWLLEFRELSQSTTGGRQKTFDKMSFFFFVGFIFSSIKCFFSLHCMNTPMFPSRQLTDFLCFNADESALTIKRLYSNSWDHFSFGK